MAEFLSLLVGKLLDYTAVPVGRQFGYLFCYKANLQEFKTQLSGMETLRNDVKLRVEAAQRNGEVILPSVEAWLKRVDEASDESKGFVEEEDAISKLCFNGPLNLKIRHQRSRKAKKKASEFDTIRKDGIFTGVAVAPPPLQIWSAIDENNIDFESRRSIFNEIKKAIKDDGLGMIGIWGMPGIGKTTLVKRAANYAKDEGLFEEVAMAVVSQNPDAKAIQDQIADEIGLKLTSESDRGRAGQLLQCLLARKKILIILDDIWDRIELNGIGIPSASQHKGCKIILTTRKKAVCEEMGTGKNFTIDLLSENEALDLFLRMSGVQDRHSELGRLAEKLSEQCGRLPISIAIIARGLLNKRTVFWEDMLNQLRNSDPEKKVLDIIKLSYDNLNREEEKLFFLLCALFPEDYKIRVQVLFEYGLGLNLFERVENVDQAVVRAQKVASTLKSQCLLLDEGDENFVKMHDVIRDVALAIASKGKHAFLVRSVAQQREWSEKTAISLLSDYVEELPDSLECPQLQILILNYRYYWNLQLHDNFFAGMKNLVVLDMSGMEFVQLPQSFAALENLQTLRLNDCRLGDISAIGKLKNLASLSFCDSTIKVLPKEVGQLSNLRFFDFSNCYGLEVITPGVIRNLSQLEVLLVHGTRLSFHLGTTILSEFNYLSRLIILDICIDDASMLPDDVIFENLTKFQVSIGKFHNKRMDIFSSSSQILKLASISENEFSKCGIKMLVKKAHHLDLKNMSRISVALPSHFGGYGSLRELIVNNCRDVNFILDMCGSEYEHETPSLQLLHLMNLPSLEEISRGKFSSLLFSKLEHLKLHRLPSFVCLWSFPAESNLTTMEVASCDRLEYVFDLGSAKALSKLKLLEVRNCENLKAICLGKEQDDDIVFPQLCHLKLLDLENLASFISDFTSGSTHFGGKFNFPILKSMHLERLKSLKKIWHDNVSSKCFSNLKKLYVSECDQLVEVFSCHLDPNLSCFDKSIEFSKLEILILYDLPRLASFYNGACGLKFPYLDYLWIDSCPKLKTFASMSREMHEPSCLNFASDEELFGPQVSFGRLRKFRLEGLELIEEIWHRDHPATTVGELTNLVVKCCDRLLKIFPANLGEGLQNLEKLKVIECRQLEHVLAVEDHPPSLSSLKYLKFSELPELKQLWWNKNCCQSFGLPSLCGLEINKCPGLEFIFYPSDDNCLENLKFLAAKNCCSMVEIVAETLGKKVDFPLLERLELVKLPVLKVKQNVEFSHAEFVLVNRCFNMKTSCAVNVKKKLLGPVRFFESFVELMKSELDSSTSDSSEEEEVVGGEPSSQHERRDNEVEGGVGENKGEW